jgi:prevent-host-death family protein
MKCTYTITEAQARLPQLVRETAGGGTLAITRHGETAAYLVSKDRLEGMLETLELLANPEVLKAVESDRKGRIRYAPLEALDG